MTAQKVLRIMNANRIVRFDNVDQRHAAGLREVGKAVIQALEYIEKTLILNERWSSVLFADFPGGSF